MSLQPSCTCKVGAYFDGILPRFYVSDRSDCPHHSDEAIIGLATERVAAKARAEAKVDWDSLEEHGV